MKKVKTLLLALICAFATISLCACGNTDENESKDTQKTTVTTTTASKTTAATTVPSETTTTSVPDETDAVKTTTVEAASQTNSENTTTKLSTTTSKAPTTTIKKPTPSANKTTTTKKITTANKTTTTKKTTTAKVTTTKPIETEKIYPDNDILDFAELIIGKDMDDAFDVAKAWIESNGDTIDNEYLENLDNIYESRFATIEGDYQEHLSDLKDGVYEYDGALKFIDREIFTRVYFRADVKNDIVYEYVFDNYLGVGEWYSDNDELFEILYSEIKDILGKGVFRDDYGYTYTYKTYTWNDINGYHITLFRSDYYANCVGIYVDTNNYG